MECGIEAVACINMAEANAALAEAMGRKAERVPDVEGKCCAGSRERITVEIVGAIVKMKRLFGRCSAFFDMIRRPPKSPHFPHASLYPLSAFAGRNRLLGDK